jgi:molecular chaperone HtpG
MSYIKSLKDLLCEKNKELFNRLPEIEKHARTILQYSQAKFPYYTPHGFLHSENVLENLNWLLPEALKAELNPYELFFLIVSAWLHDWGLIGTAEEDPTAVRESHNVRTEEKFERHFALVGLSLNEARIVGRICRGHRKEDLFNGQFDDIPFKKGIMIHMQFLTAALRMADEVDVTASRVPEIVYFDLNPTEKAEEEFKKQMNIIGIAYPSDREKFKLALSAIAWDPIGVAAITRVKDKIQEELNNVKTILATGVNHIGMQLDYVDLRIDTRGFMKDPIEFTIDREKILDLLIGRSLYPRKNVAIRELIQNAIDACRRRSLTEKNYSPEITVSKDHRIINIDDNGIGMDFAEAKKYLSCVGSSYYTSAEFLKLSEDQKFDPISRWGLGFLSCFLISSEVIIETKKADSQPCRFTISSIGRGWRYEIGARKTCGTSVQMHLMEEGKALDLLDTIKFYVKRSEIPIYLLDGSFKSELLAPSGASIHV